MLATPAAASVSPVSRAGGGDRDERERERLPLAGAEVDGRLRRGREPHRDDDLADGERDERAVVLGRPAVELEQRQLALAVGRAHDDGGAARRERRREVGGVRGDAVPLLEVVLAVVADLGVAGVAAAEPARPLLAAVVPAARVLAEVAAHRALVAQERRGGEAGGRRHGRVRREQLGAGELGERRRRADPHAVAVGRDPAEPGVLQVDEQRRRADAAVDLAREVGAAGEHGGAVAASGARAPRRPIAGSRVRAHASASSTRSRVSGSAAARRPVACANAFAIAAAVGTIGGSPSPFEPTFGRFASGTFGKSITISGTSAIVGIL